MVNLLEYDRDAVLMRTVTMCGDASARTRSARRT
jgi:hypothetical protein